MRTSLTMALVLVAMGCTAQIPDGRIGCMVSRTCPPGFFCWDFDSHCHRMPEEAGMRDASTPGQDANVPDGGGPPGPYAACGAGDSCGPDLTCLGGTYCSPACSAGSCIDGGICFGTRCLRACELPTPGNPDPCPGGAICALGLWNGTTPSAACADEATIFPSSHGDACGSDTECMPPETCERGACLRPCSEMGPCGAQENCAPVPDRGTDRACISECPSGTCDPGFTCTTNTPRNCFPTSWPTPPS